MKSQKRIDQIIDHLFKEFRLHDWHEVTDQGIRIYHNCGCHENLLEGPFYVEPTRKFQAFLDRYEAWFSIENPEAGEILFTEPN